MGGHRVLCTEQNSKELSEQVLGSAQRAAKQLCSMFQDGKLNRCKWNESLSGIEGTLEDYAFAIQGLLALYQQDFDVQWYNMAKQLQETLESSFGGLGKR